MTTEYIRRAEQFRDSLLSGVDKFDVRRNCRNLVAVSLFNRVAEDNSHLDDRTNGLSFGLWGGVRPRNSRSAGWRFQRL